MPKQSILVAIKQLRRPVFTTRELAAISGSSLSSTIQALNLLCKKGLALKISRGIWCEVGDERLSPYVVIPFLLPTHRVYVSFISALHLYGIIEQIPQVITLASTMHTKTIHTRIGTYSIHQISPLFFSGFDWYRGSGDFLIAEPEKALVDCLYLSARKKKQFGYFPELSFSKSFSFKKAEVWARKIPNSKISSFVVQRLDKIKKEALDYAK